MISHTIQSEFGEIQINGICDAAFNGVLETFEENFRERGELGACVCITQNNVPVVDLWGGLAKAKTKAPWTRDTVSFIWSSTKGAMAVCVHMLVSRGLIDLDAPLARYWPEFGQKGKQDIPVHLILSHQGGIPHWRKRLKDYAFLDWDYMVKACEEEEPFWKPGERHGYHALSIGFLCGELVRRVTGKTIGAFFQEEVAKPLGLDFWIGLPEEYDPRMAAIMMPGELGQDGLVFADEGGPTSDFYVKAATEPDSIQGLQEYNHGGFLDNYYKRAYRAAESPAVGGISNARGLAGMYAPLACGGKTGNFEMVDADTLARMGAVAAAGNDATLLLPTRYGLGFHKGCDNRGWKTDHKNHILMYNVIMSEDAFGHVGFGGSIGLADPAANMSFGYVMNRMGMGIGLNPRGQSLLDAAYRSLGYRSNASGRWTV
ncbi:MAG: beta-lactamase family protein [Deltaproteobacteria bacterium]|nr:beta-lactamase family protein [Deltaproteobacteria bacterium]